MDAAAVMWSFGWQMTMRNGCCPLACRYEDDKDEGEWFLYTGSGGRDLSGNKRVNKVQSFDQTFDKMNKALLLSCEKGLPVRVVRSHKVRAPALPRDKEACSESAHITFMDA